MFGIEGCRVLVTASSRGIGFGIAKVLVKEGCRVVINGRNKERLEKSVEELKNTGKGEVYGVQADLAVKEEVEKLVDKTIDYLGGLDALVYVTGPPKPGFFSDLSLEDWEYGINLLIKNALWLTYKAIPYLEKSGNPSITYLTSVAVKEPIPNIALSNTLRISIHGLAKTLASELGSKGIRVNTVLPGYIMTDRVKQLVRDRSRRENRGEDEILKEITAKIPLGRIGEPEEVGYLVAFLISPYASYINGAAIPIDGGLLRSVF